MNMLRSLKWHHGLIGILALNLSACHMNGFSSPFATEEPAYQNTVISNEPVNNSRIYRSNGYTGNGYSKVYAPRMARERRAVRHVRSESSESNEAGPTDGPTSSQTIKPAKIPVM